MNPAIDKILEEDGELSFRLYGVDKCLANGLRRTMISDIPTLVFERDNSKIEINTSRFTNEIIQHRISAIPIHSTDHKKMQDYVLELDKQNTSDDVLYVTTADFKLKHKETGEYMPNDELRKIFPSHPITKDHIDVIRLLPKRGDTIPGQHIKLTNGVTLANCKKDALYNAVSTCSYGYTIDPEKVEKAIDELRNKMSAEGATSEEIEFSVKNFRLLDAQRYYLPNSFDFTVESVGVYDNKEVVRKAASILHNKFADLIDAIESGILYIKLSETTMENSYDIVLENEDYTIGPILQYVLFETYYTDQKIMSFCGFKKFHPHDTNSVVRVAYENQTEEKTVRQHLKYACEQIIPVYKYIWEFMK